MIRTIVEAHDVFLTIHIAAGSFGLLLGPVLFSARKRRGLHTIGGELYHWNFVVLFLTAVVLAAMNWDEVWWLALVGAFSYSFALRGYLAAKRRRPGWLPRHIAGQGGSYISMTTALLVVNLGTATPVAWILPTLVGAPLIAWTTVQVMQGKRPKRARPAT
jgi:hypothetical protein